MLKSKSVALVSCIALATSLVPAQGAFALAAQGADDTVSVATAAELQAVSERVAAGDNMTGITVVLTEDIDLSGMKFTPIGTGDSAGVAFAGTFDGQNHTIKNMNVYTGVGETGNHQWQALFGKTDGAVVKNLSLVDASVSCGAQYSSKISLLCTVANNSTFENCLANGSVASEGAAYETTFSGMFCDISNTKVISCTLDANLESTTPSTTGSTASNYLLKAGITLNATAGSVIQNCTVRGALTAGVSKDGGYGAFAGKLTDSAITGCTNYATVTGHMNQAGYMGGIVGYAKNATITNCVNEGALQCDDANTVNNMEPVGGYIAGIAGGLENSAVTNCKNLGTITSDCKHYSRFENPSEKYASSIACIVTKGSTVSFCANTANIINSIEGLDYAYAYSAGLVSKLSDSELSDCYTTGSISTTVTSVYNNKKLKCRCAGIVLWTRDSTITNCYNTGVITNEFQKESIFEPEIDAICVENSEGSESTFSNVYCYRGTWAPSCTYGTGLTAAAMKDSATYAGWDFGNTWQMTSAGLPALKWEGDVQLTPLPDDVDFSGAIANVTGSAFTYTGKQIAPKVVVKLDGNVLTEGTDYTVAYSSNVNAGTAKIAIEGAGVYVGSTSATFSIAKAANGLSAKVSPAKLKAKALKKKAGKATVTVTGARGKVTYKSSSKKVKVSAKGKVTVKKKTKKGTYKITVTAAGDANHAAASKVLTLKVK